MNQGRILVVDDEPQIRRVMRTTLVAQGYEVADARSGEDALELLRADRYDLVLLDINLHGISGIETCREIRATSDIAVIMLTVRDGQRDKVEAFDAGADDYVTKPFGISELLARVRAALRRTSFHSESGATSLHLGGVEIDFQARRVIAHGDPVRLTSKEFDLLSYLASHANRTVTHRELLQAVWGPDYGDEQEYLHVFVNRLRKKIERSSRNPKYLLTEPWVGYRLEVPSEVAH
ncbi:MAG: response regulator transcription factor [Candidatus Acidiferrales bacterium]